MCYSMNRQHFLICSSGGKLGNTVIKSLVVVQEIQAQTAPFLHHTTSVTPDRSVPKVFARYGFVKSVDPLRHQAFLNGYFGLVDLKERPADHNGAYLQAQELHFIDKFDRF